ncbi:MAG: HIT family protein [Gammaproteobacteria bacterium]|nr:HIT family protein [Gammaproteobacteria bacterium]
MFELHADLRRDCFAIGTFPLCNFLAMNDANFPWFILVPARHEVREIYQLNETDQLQLLRESSYLAQQLALEFNADKINIAALGNITPQLHIHHIVRYRSDPAWPKPVWGQQPATPYTVTQRAHLLTRLRRCLTRDLVFVLP